MDYIYDGMKRARTMIYTVVRAPKTEGEGRRRREGRGREGRRRRDGARDASASQAPGMLVFFLYIRTNIFANEKIWPPTP